MTVFDRSASAGYRLVDEWDGGFGWLVHPEEVGRRVSHAVVGEAGRVWLLDPLDAPGIDDEIEALGEVAGVAVCSSYHARDADRFAERFDVPVFVPRWLDRVDEIVDAPIERYDGALGSSGFRTCELRPLSLWCEAIAYREADSTLYVPDVLGSAPVYTVGDERLGVYVLARLSPPLAAFDGIEPERILLGHGEGIFDDASEALVASLAGARRRFPRALVTSGPTQLRAIVSAVRS